MRSVDEMLTLPIEELMAPDVQIRLPKEDLEHWGISNRDLWALTFLGLPLIEVSQYIPNPESGPHAQEWGDRQGYHLGILRRLDVILAVDSGEVLGIAADDQSSTPAFINSTAEMYVESSWRFYWLQQILGDEITLETYDKLDSFLAKINEIDPAVGNDAHTSFWPGEAEGW